MAVEALAGEALAGGAGGPAMLRLDDFAALKVSGAERRDFLQGQLSQDLAGVTAAQAAPAAWCNRQGRVLCLMVAVDWNDALFLLLPAGLAESCAAGLGRYILRAKVRIERFARPVFGRVGADRGESGPGAAWQCVSGPEHCAVRLPGNGRRSLLLGEPPAEAAAAGTAGWTAGRWRLADIKAEIPWVDAETSGRFLAHSLNLDRSGAVSFAKGCYVGQEIIARMEHRGTPKRRMRRVRLAPDAAAAAGAKLTHPQLGAITIIAAAAAGDCIEALAEVRVANSQPQE